MRHYIHLFSVMCMLSESLKSVFQKRGRCVVCGTHFSVIKPVIQFQVNKQPNENFQDEARSSDIPEDHKM